MATEETWSVAGLEIPLPPLCAVRPSNVGLVATWTLMLTGEVDQPAAWRRWEAWAAAVGLSSTELGPGFSRCFTDDDLRVTISTYVLPGSNECWVTVLVTKRSCLPLTLLTDGALYVHGMCVPVPQRAEPGKWHPSKFEDTYGFRLQGVTRKEVEALYVPWAEREGLILHERVDNDGLLLLLFNRPTGGQISIQLQQFNCTGLDDCLDITFSKEETFEVD